MCVCGGGGVVLGKRLEAILRSLLKFLPYFTNFELNYFDFSYFIIHIICKGKPQCWKATLFKSRQWFGIGVRDDCDRSQLVASGCIYDRQFNGTEICTGVRQQWGIFNINQQIFHL